MSETALIVHDIMDTPERWKERKPGIITNGYYTLHINASQYGMGEASYYSTQADMEILRKAVQYWKKESGNYSPPETEKNIAPPPATPQPITKDEMDAKLLQAFFSVVRKAHIAYTVHMDASVFSNAVGAAISEYDARKRGGVP